MITISLITNNKLLQFTSLVYKFLTLEIIIVVLNVLSLICCRQWDLTSDTYTGRDRNGPHMYPTRQADRQQARHTRPRPIHQVSAAMNRDRSRPANEQFSNRNPTSFNKFALSIKSTPCNITYVRLHTCIRTRVLNLQIQTTIWCEINSLVWAPFMWWIGLVSCPVYSQRYCQSLSLPRLLKKSLKYMNCW